MKYFISILATIFLSPGLVFAACEASYGNAQNFTCTQHGTNSVLFISIPATQSCNEAAVRGTIENTMNFYQEVFYPRISYDRIDDVPVLVFSYLESSDESSERKVINCEQVDFN